MTARLTALPDALRGGAWPSPARAVRCPVKSGKSPYGGGSRLLLGVIGLRVYGMLIGVLQLRVL